MKAEMAVQSKVESSDGCGTAILGSFPRETPPRQNSSCPLTNYNDWDNGGELRTREELRITANVTEAVKQAYVFYREWKKKKRRVDERIVQL